MSLTKSSRCGAAPFACSLFVVVAFVVLAGTKAWAGASIPSTQFPISVDGNFTAPSEWSDVTPFAFVSPPDNNGTLQQTTTSDPAANSFMYVAAPSGAPLTSLSIIHDYLPRTQSSFAAGEFIADIRVTVTQATLPPTLPAQLPIDATLHLRGTAAGGTSFAATADVTSGGVPLVTNSPVTLPPNTVGLGFNTSANSPGSHMILELGSPIQALVSAASAELGIPINIDDFLPATIRYRADFANDLVDPPAADVTFTFNADGTGEVTQGGEQGGGPGPNPIPLPPAVWAGLVGMTGALGTTVRMRRRAGSRS